MPQKDTISVFGNGGWGTTLAILLAEKGRTVSLWGAFPEYSREMAASRENRKFLPGFRIPAAVKITSSMEVAAGASLAVIAAPSQFVRDVAKQMKKAGWAGRPVLIVAKGLETKSLMTMSQVVREELGRVPFAVLSGPNIARDIAMKMPSAAVVASGSRTLRGDLCELFETDFFTLFETDDVMGVELGGSLKNVIAISAGIVQGLGFGSNTSAVLFARGLAEMARMGKAMGARRETFMGLSGLGDLATTCLSPHSRNRTLGEAIGKGRKLKEILSSSEMVVEGVETTRSAVKLAKKLKVRMPIAEAVHGILFDGKNPKEALVAVMKSGGRRESD